MNGPSNTTCNIERVKCTCPGQWLYLLEGSGVLYSEILKRFVGLDAAGVCAYRAFEAGAHLDDLKVSGNDQSLPSITTDALEALYALSKGTFPGEDVSEAWPAFNPSRCNDPEGVRIEVGGIPISLQYPSGPLERICRDYFRNCPATTEQARCCLSAQQERSGWVIRVNGREFLALQGREQIGLGLMHAARALMYAEGDYDIAIHAAMVANDDCGIMICGPRECGKSTLAAYLVAQGFGFFTDEPALLHLDTWSVKPLPLPVSLKQGSWPALSQQWPQLASAAVHLRSDGTKICLAHLSDEHRSAMPRRLTQTVFPQYCPTSLPQLEPVSPFETLRLLNNGGMVLAKHYTRDHFEAFLKLMCITPAYKLKYASLDDACRMLHETAGSGSLAGIVSTCSSSSETAGTANFSGRT